MNARDLIRLEEISRLSDDPLKAFNSKTGKYLLRKMGLNKSAEGIEHLANKYGNEELAARYRRRLSSKPELKKIEKDINELDRQSLSLEVKTRRRDPYVQQKRIDKNLRNDLAEGKISQEYYDKVSEKLGKAAMNRYWRFMDEKSTLRGARLAAKEDYDNIAKNLLGKKVKRNIAEGFDESKNNLSKIRKDEVSLPTREKILKEVKKRTGAETLYDSIPGDEYLHHPSIGNETIHLSPTSSNSSAGHEAGHSLVNARRARNNDPRLPDNPLFTLANEAQASSHSVGLQKRLGGIVENPEELEEAFNTYHQNSLLGRMFRKYNNQYSPRPNSII